ncbi:signal peptidase II [Roseomonas frigidaquae]|uniref:Lipoprotein signal peptidase n=1 Tax=Falsiroseomonas frigidaquae TaxID=487318 RepID=A0ABX1EUC8_9PROT|nr:signal peptidase II [Falsiroseomonas frigidaquae]NKE43509.1 signal peptidase II [Falsiroseomonas frigidaquae]
MTRIGLALAFAVLLLDQATKHYMLFMLDLPSIGHIPLVALGPLGFDLTMVWNRGVTFGMLAGDSAWSQAALGLLALGIAGFLLRWMSRAENRLTALALGAVVGGAVGNVIDRFRFGAVADFFDAHAWGWHWYVFNPADAAIVLGVAALIADALFRPSPKAKGSTP